MHTYLRPILLRVKYSNNSPIVFKRGASGEVNAFQIATSSSVVDRGSKFVGHACRISSSLEAQDVLLHIRASKTVRKASHLAMYAWRIKVEGRIVEGSSDDGETNSGQLLLSILRTRTHDSHLVAVTRFYGGKQLGGDRFRHIRTVASEALNKLEQMKAQ